MTTEREERVVLKIVDVYHYQQDHLPESKQFMCQEVDNILAMQDSNRDIGG